MTQDEVARAVLLTLDRLAIPYVIVGSYASNAWGHPRATHDLDVVVELSESAAASLAKALGDDFYVSEEGARRAALIRDMFNLIHIPTGTKVDVWVRPDTDYERTRWARRVPIQLLGQEVSVATPEDTILAKLVWYRKGGEVSDLQRRDAQGVWEVQADRLDRQYLTKWARTLGIEDLLRGLAGETTSAE